PDSDGDGLPDGIEVRLGLSPLARDTNFNGIPDGSEDSDFDGVTNFDEVREFLDPSRADTDGDGLGDLEELTPGADGFVTDGRRADTDRDGMPDGYESVFGLDPVDPADAPLDPDGDGLTNREESVLGSNPFDPDAVRPAVDLVGPADGETGVPVNSVVVVRFTEPILSASVVTGVVRLFAGDQELAGAVARSSDGLSVTFAPAAQLAALTLHTVRVSGVRDLASNLMSGVTETSFTTGDFLDTIRPTVVRTSLVPGQIDIPVNSPVTVEFSEPMNPATLNSSTWTVRDNSSALFVPGMVQVDPDGRTASFVPAQPLRVRRSHTVNLTISIRDRAGNQLLSSISFSFTTALDTDQQRPVVVAIGPPDGARGVPINSRLVVQLDEPADNVVAPRGVGLATAAGEPVPGSVALSDANRR
ncbi:MAG: Ig-like domain-containing protein, partial [Chloroflexi bacterium]|nr:Ig-like domain-containing protein [Chloroflexota bacterium]